MENQRKIFALFLCALLFVIYKETIWDPFMRPVAPIGTVEGSGTAASSAASTSSVASSSSQAPVTSAPAPSAPVAGPTAAAHNGGMPTDADVRLAGIVNVQTATFDVDLSLLGGRITSLKLRGYRQTDEPNSAELDLVQHVEGAPFPLGIYSGGVDDAGVLYSLADHQSPSISVSGETPVAVPLHGVLPDGRTVEKVVTFHPTGYLIDVSVKLGAPVASATVPAMELEWAERLSADSPSLLDPYNISGFVWFDGEKAHRTAFSAFEGTELEMGDVRWVAAADKYFMATLILPEELHRGRALKSGEIYQARLSGSDTGGNFRLFAGPKKYRMLHEIGYELHRTIDFGWTGFVAAPLLFLLHVLYDLFGNYGVAIVALTILVKAVLYPLNTASFKQMKAMQELQPEVKRIRETVKDRQQQQIELMSLYKKRGVNPMGGCLPLLIQMPVFIGLYSSLLLAIELRHAPFAFWIKDLSAPESLQVFGIGIPVLVLLMVISMLVQQWVTPTTADPMQKKVMLIMPLIFGFMFVNFPAGLTMYMLTNNLISIAQQQAMQRRNDRVALMAALGTAAGVFLLTFILAKIG